MKNMLHALALSLLLAAAVVPALADPYRIDASHSSVAFSIRHIFTMVDGRFTKFKGYVEFDPNAPEKVGIDISVETASVSTDNERRDADLRGAKFFMADSFPLMSFKSTKSFKKGKTLFIQGNLTIRGITKTIEAPFEVLGVGGEPGKMVAGFSSTFKINRKDFGIVWNKAVDQGGMMLGDEVDIRINIEAKFFLE